MKGIRGEAASELICIACPIGCRLRVVKDGGEVAIAGNLCPKGEVYGREEMLSPKRVVTAVVRTDSPSFPCIPVRTDNPLPRSLIPTLVAELSRLQVRLPAVRGAILIGDYRGTGVSILLTRSLPPDEIPPIGEAGPKAEGEDEVPRF
jgi:CxxC motif-containing protein